MTQEYPVGVCSLGIDGTGTNDTQEFTMGKVDQMADWLMNLMDEDEDRRGQVVIGWNPDINYPGKPWV